MKNVAKATALVGLIIIGLAGILLAVTSAMYLLKGTEHEPKFDEKAYAREVLDQAGGTNVTIKWSNDPDKNCAVSEKHSHGGCYRMDDQEAIIVSPGMSADSLHYVVLHEYAHYIQHHYVNNPPTAERDIECDADKRAVIMGAPPEKLWYANSADYDYCYPYFARG